METKEQVRQQPAEESPWFLVRGDLDDFIFYDPQKWEPPHSCR